MERKKKMKTKKLFSGLLWLSTILLLLVGAACSTSTSEDSSIPPAQVSVSEENVAAPTEAQTEAESEISEALPAEEENLPSDGAVTSMEDVQSAVIQIEYLGAFRDPQVGAVSGYGYGSGFIIDPSGIAVTNNHVVAGAASLKVRIGGDTSKTYNAKILGVSECSDLAVIDIEGDGFPYLNWYPDDISVGLEIYAAGFPLGEPEYTLTRGVVSKASTTGETAWASVDGVIGHDAIINPGNSGGPLVTSDGQVVGVNYRSRPDYNQYFAIGAAKATSLVDELRTGTNVDSIGVNGEAVIADDESFSGVWVSSVESGSPADKMGLEGGDIMLTMEGVALAKDVTMADYCDILRSHDASDVLEVEVLRFDTKEVLKGQINGDPLSVSFSFGQAAEEASGGNKKEGSTEGSVVQFEDSLASGGADGADKFMFLGLAGGELTVYIAPSSANLDVAIVVLDGSNKAVASIAEAGAGEVERLTYAIPSGSQMQAYTIYVMGADTGGDYQAIFVGSPPILFKLQPNFLVAGSPSAGKTVGYTYAGSAGKTLTVAVTSDKDNPIDARVRIYSSYDLKNPLVEVNSSGRGEAELLSFPIPADDLYIIMIDDAQGGSGSFLMATSTK
jgi:S1-C subfamily serine protease